MNNWNYCGNEACDGDCDYCPYGGLKKGESE